MGELFNRNLNTGMAVALQNVHSGCNKTHSVNVLLRMKTHLALLRLISNRIYLNLKLNLLLNHSLMECELEIY